MNENSDVLYEFFLWKMFLQIKADFEKLIQQCAQLQMHARFNSRNHVIINIFSMPFVCTTPCKNITSLHNKMFYLKKKKLIIKLLCELNEF